jgi:adenine-specific DNA methylase
MDAKQFAEWLVGVTDGRAETRAREIYTTASTVQQAVRTEIEEATTQFPLLKSNKEFRDLTLAVIESDASRGKVTPIIEASKKVSAMMTAQKQTETQTKNDKTRKRTAVEAPKGGANDAPDTDAQRVLNSLKKSGGAGNPMGGLGI